VESFFITKSSIFISQIYNLKNDFKIKLDCNNQKYISATNDIRDDMNNINNDFKKIILLIEKNNSDYIRFLNEKIQFEAMDKFEIDQKKYDYYNIDMTMCDNIILSEQLKLYLENENKNLANIQNKIFKIFNKNITTVKPADKTPHQKMILV